MEVTDRSIRAVLDGEPLFETDLTGREVGMRSETNLSRPLGIASYVTTAAVKAVRIRPLTAAEVAAVNAACADPARRGAPPKADEGL